MARRAFVVGSEIEGLSGAAGDARRMAAALGRYGFEVDLCAGAAATRAGILEGYGRLVEASEGGDAALFYYSGHGAFGEAAPGAEGRGEPTYVQCLVPVDFKQTTTEAFYGVAAQELSLLLARLTAKTRNATVILDCCHAAGASRYSRVWPKALPQGVRTSVAAVEAAVRRLLPAARAAPAAPHAESNPHAVRLVATGLRNYAWEYKRPSGEVAGAFTDALLVALDEARGQRVTWEALGDRVRETVLAKFPAQRPEIEGPARRLLFELAEGPATHALVAARDASTGRHVLRGGRIHGVHEGDEYALAAGLAFEPGRRLGVATVVEVGAAESAIDVAFDGAHASLPAAGARALPLRSAALRRPVRVDAPEAEGAAIERALADEPLLRAYRGDGDDATPPLARVSVVGGRIELFDPWGEPATAPLPYREGALKGLVDDLRRMASVLRWRELKSEPSAGLAAGSVEVSWGRVSAGGLLPLASQGERLEVGASIYVRVRNRHPENKYVYVSVVDLGVANKIALLTNAWPSGCELKGGEEYVLGRGVDAVIRGAELCWPAGLPADRPRPETLVVVVAERPRNMRPVEAEGLECTRGGGASALEQIVWQARKGGKRDLRPGEAPEGYLIYPIDFELSPRALAP